MAEQTAPSMYVSEEPGGMFALRQTRYRGKRHPHDVCAVARSREELKAMCEKHWPDVKYDAE